MCVSISHWDFEPLIHVVGQIRESKCPGGINHACELETSMYLAINDTLVQMDKAVGDMDNLQASKYFWLGLVGSGEGKPVMMMPYWSTISKTSTLEEPTVRQKKKEKLCLRPQ